MEHPTLTIVQKGLLIALYGLLALMIIFSFLSLRNLGKEGYEKCMQKRCSIVGEASCQKLREVSSCCLGAGGKVLIQNNQYRCGFEN